jgi:ubiquinone/menaquinone biosynthesis C-methylase UbiE
MPDRDLVVAAFTELAPAYESTVDRELRMFWDITYREFLARLITAANVMEDEVVLDIATGTAYLPAQVAVRLGSRGLVFGLDITPAMLLRASARLAVEGCRACTRLMCGSALAMPVASETFDVAMCALATHHIEASRLVAEMHRVLRPGGRLVLADVCATRFWQSRAGALLLRVLIFGYLLAKRTFRAQAEIEAIDNMHTAGEWRQLLAEHGFTDITLNQVRPRFPWYPGGFVARAVRL